MKVMLIIFSRVSDSGEHVLSYVLENLEGLPGDSLIGAFSSEEEVNRFMKSHRIKPVRVSYRDTASYVPSYF